MSLSSFADHNLAFKMDQDMSPDPLVITELRNLFKAGATPSRLVRYIVDEHGISPDSDRLIRAYFREAFGVSLFRASASLLTIPSEELPFAAVNARTIHQMIEKRSEWDVESDCGSNWLDSLTATDPSVLLERTASEQTDEQSLKRLIGGSQYLHEQVAILSRLVEQLQHQVITLERQPQMAAIV